MSDRTIPYYRPWIEAEEIDAVVESMRNGWLTTGPRVKEFEQAFAQASGVKHAVALNSCTAGLHLGLAALGVGVGDEVILPSLTFVAAAQCVRHLGAVPVLADVGKKSLCLTLETVRPLMTARTKVIMPMHYGGAPIEIESITAFAHAHGVKVLEDAAHAVGTLDGSGRWAGAISDGASYSFYATKNITSAEGGMFVTNDDSLADAVRILSLHGMDKDAWKRYSLGGKYGYDVVATGFKYNMPDMAAALGLTQLAKLELLQEKRRQIAGHYLEALGKIPGILPVGRIAAPPSEHSWCVFAVLVGDDAGCSRDEMIRQLSHARIGTSVHFIPIHMMSAYKGLAAYPLPVTDSVAPRLISLPLYPSMSSDDVTYVTTILKSIVGRSSSLDRKTVSR